MGIPTGSSWTSGKMATATTSTRHCVGKDKVREKGIQYEGLRCDEAGWVDIMEFLHHGWIFDHEKVKTEDGGLIPTCFLGGSSQFDDQDRMGRVPEAGQGSDSVLVHRLGLQLHGA